MLTEADRAAGHRLAGEWLERAGEKDALTLANHFELGRDPKRAVSWLVQAARVALDGGNLQATIALSDRASRDAEDVQRGNLGRLRAAALSQRGDFLGAAAVGGEAIKLLPVGSSEWLICVANRFWMGASLGDQSIAAPMLQLLLTAPGAPEPTGPYGWAICSACAGLTAIGQLDIARSLLEPAERLEKSHSDNDPAFVTGLRIARGYLLLSSGALGSALEILSEARTLADSIVHETARASSRLLRVGAYVEAGNSPRAEEEARDLRLVCEPGGMSFYTDRSKVILASARIGAHPSPDVIEQLQQLVEQSDRPLAMSARGRLSHALLAAGNLDGAEREARKVLEEGIGFPSTQPTANGALALVAMCRRQPADALVLAERGLDAASRGSSLRDGSILRLVRVEALHALGRGEETRAALREARDRIRRVAATLDEPELRESYVRNIAANARTLSLAREWLGEDEP